MDTDTDRGHEEDCCCKWEQASYLVKVTGHLEFCWCASECPSGLRIQEALNVNRDPTPVIVFLLLFMKVTQLLVAEIDKYYNQYLDTFHNDGGRS